MNRGARCAAAVAILLAAAAVVASAAPPAAPAPDAPRRVLVFTRTAGFRHDSIPAATRAMAAIVARTGLSVESTEDPARFTSAVLADCAAVVFLHTTGDVLDDAGERALREWVEGGGAWIGVHAAADTEYDWPWYRELCGARFAGHPPVQPAGIDVVDRDHPSTAHLPARWTRTDEWYDFDGAPPKGARILLRLDESTYEGGGMGADHPAAWCRTIGKGRAAYTAGGHTIESWSEPDFLRHVEGLVRWGVGEKSANGQIGK